MKQLVTFFPAGLTLAVALAAFPAAGQSTNSPTAPTAADLAWRELQGSFQQPPAPSEWRGNKPTPAQSEAYLAEQGRLAGIAADKAKTFIAQYPDSDKITEAKRQYARMLQNSVALGNQARAAELETLQAERMKDPNTPEQERFTLRVQALMKELATKEESEKLAGYEKVALLLIKEFPKRAEPYKMLLDLAGSADTEHAKELLRVLTGENVPAAIQEQARAMAARIDERVGQPLEIKFKATNDQEVDLQNYKGKVVLVDFWATWCGPCVKEIPNVRATYEKLHPKGFEIVGISFDDDRKRLDDFVAREKMPWVQYYDGKRWGNEIGKKYGINGIPAMWLVDKKGIVRELNARANLEKMVEKYLAEN